MRPQDKGGGFVTPAPCAYLTVSSRALIKVRSNDLFIRRRVLETPYVPFYCDFVLYLITTSLSLSRGLLVLSCLRVLANNVASGDSAVAAAAVGPYRL